MRFVLVLALAITALGVSSTVVPAAHAASPVGVRDIVAGSVDRSSLGLRATYDVRLKLTWSTRRIGVDARLVVTNTATRSIDRLELNTVAARLGNLRLHRVTVDGVPVKARRSDQTIIVPLGGVLPVGGITKVRVEFGATLRSNLAGSNWLFTRTNGVADLYRWLPWISRTTPFTRPNHGDPFVTPSSPFVRVRIDTDRRLVFATTGSRVSKSPNGLTQTFEARDVRDFTVTAATDYRTNSRRVGNNTVVVYYRRGAPGATMLDAAADAFKAIEARLGPYPYGVFKVVQSAGGYGMESPGLIWIPTGVARSNLRYLAAHETAHQWFYGIVGNDQAREPFTDEAAADLVARSVTGTKRGSRCSTGRLDLSIYRYTSSCYYEKVYIQGGNVLDSARKRMGSAAFWAALRGYIAANRFGLSNTGRLLDALDDATPIDLGRTLFGPRFPRLY